jgi:phosphoribosylcarboxyaminoimidazole (NCAIR) mutase
MMIVAAEFPGPFAAGYTIRVIAKDRTPEEMEQFFRQAGFRFD